MSLTRASVANPIYYSATSPMNQNNHLVNINGVPLSEQTVKRSFEFIALQAVLTYVQHLYNTMNTKAVPHTHMLTLDEKQIEKAKPEELSSQFLKHSDAGTLLIPYPHNVINVNKKHIGNMKDYNKTLKIVITCDMQYRLRMPKDLMQVMQFFPSDAPSNDDTKSALQNLSYWMLCHTVTTPLKQIETISKRISEHPKMLLQALAKKENAETFLNEASNNTIQNTQMSVLYTVLTHVIANPVNELSIFRQDIMKLFPEIFQNHAEELAQIGYELRFFTPLKNITLDEEEFQKLTTKHSHGRDAGAATSPNLHANIQMLSDLCKCIVHTDVVSNTIKNNFGFSTIKATQAYNNNAFTQTHPIKTFEEEVSNIVAEAEKDHLDEATFDKIIQQISTILNPISESVQAIANEFKKRFVDTLSLATVIIVLSFVFIIVSSLAKRNTVINRIHLVQNGKDEVIGTIQGNEVFIKDKTVKTHSENQTQTTTEDLSQDLYDQTEISHRSPHNDAKSIILNNALDVTTLLFFPDSLPLYIWDKLCEILEQTHTELDQGNTKRVMLFISSTIVLSMFNHHKYALTGRHSQILTLSLSFIVQALTEMKRTQNRKKANLEMNNHRAYIVAETLTAFLAYVAPKWVTKKFLKDNGLLFAMDLIHQLRREGNKKKNWLRSLIHA
eukprot:95466-Hanusia_phi.AAC.4